jgi:chemotaxis protein methyltransferase CheR
MKTNLKTANGSRQKAIDERDEDADREFAFSNADFTSLAQLAREHTGIVLGESKRNLVYGRLSRRLRALGMSSFRDYRAYLDSPDGQKEIERFINSISTNLTRLFRESHHFDHLRTDVAIPFARAAAKMADTKLRIWSAGCSTGEEPYTIALVLKHEIRDIEKRDVRILATDIDTDVLAKGARGTYAIEAMEEVPPMYRSLVYGQGERAKSDTVTMDLSLRSLITFRQLNLMIKPWPMKGLFDAIFCRNVMIYFDNETKMELVRRYTAQLKPRGFLYIGHSESLIGGHPGLKLIGRTVYQRDS